MIDLEALRKLKLLYMKESKKKSSRASQNLFLCQSSAREYEVKFIVLLEWNCTEINLAQSSVYKFKKKYLMFKKIYYLI